MKEVEITKPIGNNFITFVSELIDGKKGDTSVRITGRQGHILCSISGESIGDFYDELQELIDKYRI